jgi:hypothetical protein
MATTCAARAVVCGVVAGMMPVATLTPDGEWDFEDRDTLTLLMGQLGDEMDWGGFAQARRLNDRLAERYRAALGREDLAEAVASCWATGRVELWPDDRRWHPGSSCHRPKLCAVHAHMETRRRLRVMLQRYQATKGLRLQHFVLTIPNVSPGRLRADGWDALWAAWNKIRRHRSFRAVRAALASWEVTWSLSRGDWHPHLHVLVAADWYDPATGAGDVDWDRIHREWEALTGSVQTKMTPVTPHPVWGEAGAFYEVVKYVSKFYGEEAADDDPDEPGGAGLLDMPDEALAEWFGVTNGRRAWRTYGAWYDAEDDAEDDRDDNDADAAPAEAREPVAEVRWRWRREGAGHLDVYLIRANKSASPNDVATALRTWIAELYRDRRRGKRRPDPLWGTPDPAGVRQETRR